MHQKKLITILAAFTQKELKACNNHLSASLNENTDEFRLFQYIWRSKNNFASKKLEIKRARDKVKPGLSLQNFQNLMSALVGRIEKFIISYEDESPQLKFENQLRLGAFYKKKGLYSYFKQVHRKIEIISKDLPPLGPAYQQLKMQQQHQLFFSKLTAKEDVDFLRNAWEALERFYQQKRLIYETEIANQQHLLNKNIPPPDFSSGLLFDTILQYQKEMIDDNDFSEPNFLFLENYLLNHYHEFSPESAYILLNYLINACSSKIKKKESAYIDKISALYNFGFTTSCLLYNGKLTAMSFLNIIGAWSNASGNATQKILDIISKSSEYVNSNDNEVVQSAAWAIYRLAIGDWSQSITYADKGVNNKDLGIATRANLIYLASFYCIYPNYSNKEDIINNTARLSKKIKKEMSKENHLAFTNTVKIIQMMWLEKPRTNILAFKDRCEHLFLQTWINKTLIKYSH